jgi:hypothetical protein
VHVKSKDTVHPVTCHEDPEGEYSYNNNNNNNNNLLSANG